MSTKDTASVTPLELTVRNGDVSLAGSLWLPDTKPVASVLMHPGSGPSDRDNDVYFPPIREHLVANGIAVCSFDKRGVGHSSGAWEEAGIHEQADDALACVAHVLSETNIERPLGLFGHSQGGWVVVDAASRSDDVDFVATNAGPGVTPAEQERYAARANMARAGVPQGELEKVDDYVVRIFDLARNRVPLADVPAHLDAEGVPAAFGRLGLPSLPESEAEWGLWMAIVDYDPRTALERIAVPVLALFGAEDRITPVQESVEVYRAAVPPELLTVSVFPGGNHRIQDGDPPQLVDGYLDTLSSFVFAAAAQTRR